VRGKKGRYELRWMGEVELGFRNVDVERWEYNSSKRTERESVVREAEDNLKRS
jgi:hypothetical protein